MMPISLTLWGKFYVGEKIENVDVKTVLPQTCHQHVSSPTSVTNECNA